jgi:RHS repeat-associated protein
MADAPARTQRPEPPGPGRAAAASAAQFTPPAVALPTGGGAIRGMGDKFTANPVTGTGSFSIPIRVSPGRSGFQPQLALTYDSGAGNGPFGLGWNLGLPAITRKVDKGMPEYDDAAESDVFLLSGAEDLVPAFRTTPSGELELDGDGRPIPDREERDGYRIARYRPRVEGVFARIERWSRVGDATDVFWRTISRDNVTSRYGRDDGSRIADPDDASHIFSWLICESRDDKGNAIRYDYKAEDGRGVDPALPYERRRGRTQRYIKSIRYGNVVSWLHPEPPADPGRDWLFELIFDYGEGHYADLPADSQTPVDEQHRFARASLVSEGAWAVRPDPFSAYRAGFEMRTHRRCQRVLMFHRIPELGAEPYLVRALDVEYADIAAAGVPAEQELAHEGSTRFASFLMSVTQHGYRRSGPEVTPGPHEERYLRYLRQSLPAVSFRYSKPVIDREIRVLDPASAANLPAGLGAGYQWIDLDAEGISGVLTEQGGVWWYKRNEGGGRLGALQLVAERPAGGLGGHRQLLDLAGDGALDLVEFAGPVPGFHERTDDGHWAPHRGFGSLPNLGWDDPNLRFTDLNGDGRADVLVADPDAFTWHPSLGEDGFGPARRTVQPFDQDDGPRVIFADSIETVQLADFSGDGLADLVHITNGAVCYWPNLGYGRFGPRVEMANAPFFDHDEQFAPSRIRLADVDGSGVTDLIYLGRDTTRVYLNQSGNRWTDAVPITQFPLADNTSAVSTVDLLGTGTTCLVWSSSLPGDAGAPLRYLDLMAAGKPHLLVEARNGLGAETEVHYASSNQFYLADREQGRPWITRLPFPVHVVDRVETVDRVSGNRFTSRYEYHHGHFDGVEREFRGFGRVDQYDAEVYDLTQAADSVPPVLTRTWFHTGVHVGRGRVAERYAAEYYPDPGLLDDTPLPAGLSLDEEREACRALRGSVLRQEVYALDGTSREPHPYLVTENSFTVRRLQPPAGNRHAVFLTHPVEAISYHYEREPADPRVTHTLTLAVNNFGQVTRAATIGYGRGGAEAELTPGLRADQERLLATCTDTAHTNGFVVPAQTPDDHRTPAPFEVRTYELTGLALAAGWPRFTPAQVAGAVNEAHPLGYDEAVTPGRVEKRLIERDRTRYRRNDLAGPCDWGVMHTRALPFEAYRQAFTPGLLRRTYGDRLADPAAVLPVDAAAAGDTAADRGGYVDLDGDGVWWLPTGRIFYGPAAQELDHALRHFFLPRRYRTAFHTAGTPTETTVTYDDHDLQLLATTDPLNNQVTMEPDYRTLAPGRLTDANGNRAAVAFDALGLVVATAILGKASAVAPEADRLTGFSADLTAAQVRDAFDDPFASPHDLLGEATTRMVYDLFAYQRTRDDPQPQAACVYTLARETHGADLPAGTRTKLRHTFSYSDGFEREIQKKAQAESGRWVGSGRTEFNNKGKPVRQYEPFFSGTHRCDFDARAGVAKTLFYDPVERVIAVVHPDDTYEKVVFDAWRQRSYDVNDTVTGDPRTDPDIAGFVERHFAERGPGWSTWLAQRQGPGVSADEADAATKAVAHAGTPATVYLDTLGRTFLTRAHNGFTAGGDPIHLDTRVVLDIENNQRAVIDANGRTVVEFDYDMLGNRTRESSMESGERWTLADVTGRPVRAWDSRGHAFRTEYDALRRPRARFVQATMFERVEYGESVTGGAADNLRGRTFRQYDQAGAVTFRYDLKGNVARQMREIIPAYATTVDWAQAQPPGERYVTGTRYDALNRPIQALAPHRDDPAATRDVVQPVYNEAGLLDALHVWTGRASDPAGLLDPAAEPPSDVGVANIDYDPKGRRTRIAYRNGVTTTYAYDPDTFRLIHLYTRRDARSTEDCGGEPPPPRTAAPETPPAGTPCGLQNVHYTYDPAGNITRIRDDAQQRVFYRNRLVDASNDYTYDPVYRLVQALGREHVGQAGGTGFPHSYNDRSRTNLPHPADGDAMGRYCETYEYDAAGNLRSMKHRQACPGAINWARYYVYDEPTQLDDRDEQGTPRRSNRLTSTTVAGGTEVFSVGGDGYDAHGNLLRMAHLPEMVWNFHDQLGMTRRQAIDAADTDGVEHAGERTYYVYDAGGRRARKVTETAAGAVKEDRIYLGSVEIYRSRTGLVRETLHVLDDKQRIALVETRNDVDDGTPQQVIRYQLGNHLGSAAVEVDEQARVLTYEEYAPYGSTTVQMLRTDVKITAKRYRYTGKERDEESGLSYHDARYYAPWLGCWVACDPIGAAGGLNQYVYAARNPCKFVDLSGEKPKKGDEHNKRSGKEEAKPPPTAGRSPIPTDLAKARKEILAAVAREPDPTREWQRLFPEDPDDPEHNFWVAYAVNYALMSKGFKPGGSYGPKDAKKLEEALWFLTKDLRQSDPKIGSSESLILRDAQRYLYGIQGDRWLSDYSTRKYIKDFLPKEAHPAVDLAKPYLSGKLIDRVYEQVVKRAVMAGNAAGEEITGRNPGMLRSTPDRPHSRTGGEDWYDLGMERYGKTGKGNPFILTTPDTVYGTEPSPIRLKDFREIIVPGGSFDTKTGTFKYDPKTLPKPDDLLRLSPFR